MWYHENYSLTSLCYCTRFSKLLQTMEFIKQGSIDNHLVGAVVSVSDSQSICVYWLVYWESVNTRLLLMTWSDHIQLMTLRKVEILVGVKNVALAKILFKKCITESVYTSTCESRPQSFRIDWLETLARRISQPSGNNVKRLVRLLSVYLLVDFLINFGCCIVYCQLHVIVNVLPILYFV